MAISRLKKLLLLLCLALIVGHLTLIDAKNNAKKDATDSDAGAGTGASDGKGVSKEDLKKLADETAKVLQQKYEKAKQNKKPLDGQKGKVMEVVVETIREMNPIRLLARVDPEALLVAQGFSIEKIKPPTSYFSKLFWQKMSAKTRLSNEELSKKLGVNIDGQTDKDLVSLGKLFQIGKTRDLRLGDYFAFLGLKLDSYEKKYDTLMIETLQVPVAFIDDIVEEGFGKYLDDLKKYITKHGGALNSALYAFTQLTGRDVVKLMKDAIHTVKHYKPSTNTSSDMSRQLDIYKKEGEKQVRLYYIKAMGKGGLVYQYTTKFYKTVKAIRKFIHHIINRDKVLEFIDLIGHALGPTGRSLMYIIYQPTATLIHQIFGPMLLIPKLMLAPDHPICEKLLALPPVIVQSTGNMFKPVLMVVEPLIRWKYFLITGHYQKALSLGLDLAAAYGINIWGGAYKAKQIGGAPDNDKKSAKRSKRETEIMVPIWDRYIKARHPRNRDSDQKLAQDYQGGPPVGGYKLGAKLDDTISTMEGSDMMTRLLVTPDFLLKAGGPIYMPLAAVLSPLFRSINLVLFQKGDFDKRVEQVPGIIRGVGLIGPVADVVEAMIPVIKTAYAINRGKLQSSDMFMKLPMLIKTITSGVLFEVAKYPNKMIKACLTWLEGSGGLLAMLRLQLKHEQPSNIKGHAARAHQETRNIQENFISDQLGEFIGGWYLNYVQAVQVIGSLYGALFTGILGHLVDPVKYLDTGVILKAQPIKHIVESFDDLSLMLRAANDRQALLTTLLAGHDPHVFYSVGIKAEKLAALGVHPGLMAAGGKKLLCPNQRSKLDGKSATDLGLDDTYLAKLDLTHQKFLETGLLDVDPVKLATQGIDFHHLVNLVMRGSVDDYTKLVNTGLDIPAMFRAGVNPALLLAGGIGALPADLLAKLGVTNKAQPTDDDIRKLGINPLKLQGKNIDTKKLMQSGIEEYAKREQDFGLRIQQLITSVYTGLDYIKLSKAGIDLKKMVSAGVPTKLLLIGGIKKHLKDDISQASLSKVGIDVNKLLGIGINVNLVADVGALVLSPYNLGRMGICPMRAMMGMLSLSGLDSMCGGLTDPAGIVFGFISTVTKLTQTFASKIPNAKHVPYVGNVLTKKSGKYKGWFGFVLYKILNVDHHGGIYGLLKKMFGNRMTKHEMLVLLDPIRIVSELADPLGKSKVNPIKHHSRKNRKNKSKKSDKKPDN
ncbi:uncharacterized protein LOC128952176 [Oppia nitens]|uniref:uncharacterized protein LOC128952176 n=1 Tax=Oppia nitens TaxID=1686743 RepID=UPI0023DC8A38|nr:uncharacterized protein LOC128952176 [Oppia nitens]